MDIAQRFINYTKINTTTNKENGLAGIMPSNPNEMQLASLLEKELQELGLSQIIKRSNSITTALLPANVSNAPRIAFFAHLDTSSEQKNDTKAQITHYEGGDICLNKELDLYLRESEFKELKNYKGDDIIHTDGTSLLGADDKAGIAAIMDMLEFFVKNPSLKHGDIIVGFLPDEEQGLRGAKAFDVKEVNADFGYCLDCCGIGEFIYENWNAADAIVTFQGVSAHPMSAKGKLVNSLILAHQFISMLPRGEAPEYTEGKEGYFWVKELNGNSAKTILKIDIREFDEEKYNQRIQFLKDLCNSCEKLWGKQSIQIHLSHRYKNVFNALKTKDCLPVKLALKAYENLDIKAKIIPMRGGYDGAVLSEKGLMCPNIFTGAHNFHSIYEYLPLKSLKAASKVLQEIILLASETKA